MQYISMYLSTHFSHLNSFTFHTTRQTHQILFQFTFEITETIVLHAPRRWQTCRGLRLLFTRSLMMFGIWAPSTRLQVISRSGLTSSPSRWQTAASQSTISCSVVSLQSLSTNMISFCHLVTNSLTKCSVTYYLSEEGLGRNMSRVDFLFF